MSCLLKRMYKWRSSSWLSILEIFVWTLIITETRELSTGPSLRGLSTKTLSNPDGLDGWASQRTFVENLFSDNSLNMSLVSGKVFHTEFVKTCLYYPLYLTFIMEHKQDDSYTLYECLHILRKSIFYHFFCLRPYLSVTACLINVACE